jgi:hypothetical protein
MMPVLAMENSCSCNMEETVLVQHTSAAGVGHSAVNEAESTENTDSVKFWPLTKGTLKAVLRLANTLVPELFTGAADVLLEIVDIVEVCACTFG